MSNGLIIQPGKKNSVKTETTLYESFPVSLQISELENIALGKRVKRVAQKG